MAMWSVIREAIQLFDHPNADSLQLGKVGAFQVVVQKGLYEDGNEVIFAPAKSLLPESLSEPYRKYLRGPEHDRVGQVRLRGELSMGVLIPIEEAAKVTTDLPLGQCLAERLGIRKYEPPIPQNLAGEVRPLNLDLSKHDVEEFGIYANEFDPEEPVVVTEKVHGSQLMYYLCTDGSEGLSSKGMLSKGLEIIESDTNAYWRAVRNSGLKEIAESFLGSCNVVQIFGEVVPVQRGNWTYGFDPNKPQVLVFDIRRDGQSIPTVQGRVEHEEVPWVPVISYTTFRECDFTELCKGKEQVSGHDLHIREGVVVRPGIDRFASDGTRLMVKVINPKYAKKETGEEIS